MTNPPMDYGNPPGAGPLRFNAVDVSVLTVGTGQQSDVNLPTARSDAVKKQQDALTIMRDLWGGNETVKKASTVYLPQAPGEKSNNYQDRLRLSVFFNVVKQTIVGLVGQVFRKDPELGDDVPPLLRAHTENIDLAGTHLDVFARERLQDALIAGHCAILVDFPKTGGTQNARQEQTGEVRPYWVPIRKDDIVSFRTTIENGREVLSQLVICETSMVADGAFGEKKHEQYRVLYRTAPTKSSGPVVGVRVLQVTDKKELLETDAGTYPTQDEIPVAEIITSGRKAMLVSDPPLIDLAYMNIAHYQQWSDAAYSRHMTCVPILFTAGVTLTNDQGQPIEIGANSGISATDPNAKVAYVSHDGASLEQCKEALDDLKSEMGTLGLSMLSPQRRTAETAQAKQLDKAAEDSALAVTARGLQDGLERAMYFHARYLKLASGGSLKVNREFDLQTMQADMLTAWTGAVNAGLPPRLLVTAMQTGGLVDPDEDADEVASEMQANQDAKRQAQEDAQRARLAAATGNATQPGATEAANTGTEVPMDKAA